jgi:hypothetical protein
VSNWNSAAVDVRQLSCNKISLETCVVVRIRIDFWLS